MNMYIYTYTHEDTCMCVCISVGACFLTLPCVIIVSGQLPVSSLIESAGQAGLA